MTELPHSNPLPWASVPGDLPRSFSARKDFEEFLASLFPTSKGTLSPILGGRLAAEHQLKQLNAKHYGHSRNYLNGAVTRLSPFISHGVLTLVEVRNEIFCQLRRHRQDQAEGAKLINELGWRDFWQRMWQRLGNGIWEEREEYKTGYSASSYDHCLPQDIRDGYTGLACMDAFQKQLVTTGWLHNHARMWLAAYIVHWRQIHWRTGAHWFLEHLLDGDPASNNLSWQWVASSFSHKPYIFNRQSLERFSCGCFCKKCEVQKHCPFDASYEQLQQQLFRPQDKCATY
ncbi:deoxyribodipyrimidine photo-lyase [cyanobiont of Ornithocercus magnificus]|nr:deoxyribodipyrimidine photo-lyase [cyanobiont of Ornithocercus magnificus]